MERGTDPPDRRLGPPAGLVVVLASLLLLAAACRPPASGEPRREIVVFAAASLTEALDVVADSFEQAHPHLDVVLHTAASSLLARQIDAGAAADVYFSADEAWMEVLRTNGRLGGPVRRPLSNRLVIAGREDGARTASGDALSGARRIAVGDPSHVPAGRYARQALECLGLWDRLEPRLVPMLDVRAALLAVAHGMADVGIVYASDVQAARDVRTVRALPEACQPEIRYAAAVVGRGAGADAGLFLAYATAPEWAALWASFGFEPRLSASTVPAP